jgi:hypothetical protein
MFSWSCFGRNRTNDRSFLSIRGYGTTENPSQSPITQPENQKETKTHLVEVHLKVKTFKNHQPKRPITKIVEVLIFQNPHPRPKTQSVPTDRCIILHDFILKSFRKNRRYDTLIGKETKIKMDHDFQLPNRERNQNQTKITNRNS